MSMIQTLDDNADALHRQARDAEYLAEAGLALIECGSEEDVFDVAGVFFGKVMPGALVVVSQINDEQTQFITRRVQGLDSSLLARAAKLMGFRLEGQRFDVLDEYLDLLHTRSLVHVDGGLREYASLELPVSTIAILEKMFGIHDIYTAGISDKGVAYGNFGIIVLRPNVQPPVRIIESFVHQCFLTLSKLRALRDLAGSEESHRLLFEHMSQALAVHEVVRDPDGNSVDFRFLRVNPAYESTTGMKAADVVGRTMRELNPDLDQAVVERFAAVADTQIPIRFEEPSREPGGRYLEVVAYSPRAGQFATIVSDITERKRLEIDLGESEARFRTLFEDNHVMVMLVDPNEGHIVDANPAAARFYGWSPDELCTMNVTQISTDDPRRVRSALRYERTAEPEHFLTEHRLADGSTRDVEIHSGKIVLDGRELLYSAITDVTERLAIQRELQDHREHLERLVAERTDELSRVNDELAELNVELIRASSAKSAFLANMSHELRTPLNSIIGFSGVLGQGLAGALTEEQLKQVGMINGSGRHLLSLIDDVLDLAKVEAGKIQLKVEPFGVQGLLEEVVSPMRSLLEEGNGLQLRVTLEDSNAVLTSDRGRVKQIMFNLIGNAIKFTDAGIVEVTAGCTDDGYFSFAVRDTGPGIAVADLPRVFDAFTQFEIPGIAKPKGTGLGLSLSQEFAYLLGGEITVASAEGVGSTFTFTLPVAVPLPPSIEDGEPTAGMARHVS